MEDYLVEEWEILKIKILVRIEDLGLTIVLEFSDQIFYCISLFVHELYVYLHLLYRRAVLFDKYLFSLAFPSLG